MGKSEIKDIHWDINISSGHSNFKQDWKELWKYKDLIYMFVKRDFLAVYKQTILGPLWYLVQPIFTMLVFSLVFSKLAHLPTDGIPPTLFYLSGIIFWNYFSAVVLKVSDTFTSQAGVFGKVYFPRLTVPISIVLSTLISFFIQIGLLIFLILYKSDYINWTYQFHWNQLWVAPLLIFFMGLWGLGLGIIISAITAKYRDIKYLMTFGIQLLMFATPVVYPISIIKSTLIKSIVYLNPMAVIIEAFRAVYLLGGSWNYNSLFFPFIMIIFISYLGILLFNKVAKNFMDTV